MRLCELLGVAGLIYSSGARVSPHHEDTEEPIPLLFLEQVPEDAVHPGQMAQLVKALRHGSPGRTELGCRGAIAGARPGHGHRRASNSQYPPSRHLSGAS